MLIQLVIQLQKTCKSTVSSYAGLGLGQETNDNDMGQETNDNKENIDTFL
jgi:hypothetical protein